jgi:trimethylamine---corrinoid protein Co-methyltransferase
MRTSVLTDKQVVRIHEASLSILERVGVDLPHEETLRRLADMGARVDFGAKRAFLSPDVVYKALASAGKEFTIYGRDLSKTAAFGQGQRNFNAIAGEALWVDEAGGERRYATLRDAATAARFCDALPHINIAGAMADPCDVPVAVRCVEVLAAMIRNTTKPVTFWLHNRASAKYLIEMLIVLRGDAHSAERYPLFYPFLEPISPLRFPFDGVDLLYETARLNLPVPIGPMAQMGVSAPMSLGGTMAVENAEILAGVCITQAVRPGMPVCYGGICHAFDMRTTQMIFGGPEQAIFGVAMTQMGKHYGLPVYINVGLSDSKRTDAQAGLEVGVTLAMGASAGADVFGHMGICGVDQATSLDMLVLQDEAIGYVTSMMRDVDLSDEALGLDLVEQLGPGGRFIDEMHTATRFRQELWFPTLFDRDYYERWKDNGAADTERGCRERKQEILDTHKPEPLAADLDREIDRILEAARRESGA